MFGAVAGSGHRPTRLAATPPGSRHTINAADVEGVVGGFGNDILSAATVSTPVMLDGGHGDDVLIGGHGPNLLFGGPGDDAAARRRRLRPHRGARGQRLDRREGRRGRPRRLDRQRPDRGARRRRGHRRLRRGPRHGLHRDVRHADRVRAPRRRPAEHDDHREAAGQHDGAEGDLPVHVVRAGRRPLPVQAGREAVRRVLVPEDLHRPRARPAHVPRPRHRRSRERRPEPGGLHVEDPLSRRR